jgi:hypothetical protein
MQIGCLILVVGALILGTSLTVAASIFYGELVDEVNAYPAMKEEVKGGDRTLTLYVLKLHANLFPTSGKRAMAVGLGLVGLGNFILFVVSAIVCYGSGV